MEEDKREKKHLPVSSSIIVGGKDLRWRKVSHVRTSVKPNHTDYS